VAVVRFVVFKRGVDLKISVDSSVTSVEPTSGILGLLAIAPLEPKNESVFVRVKPGIFLRRFKVF